MDLVIKLAPNLSPNELAQINDARAREFKSSPLNNSGDEDLRFFVLKDGDEVQAIGGLVPVSPVKFNGENFTIMGVGGIIANRKGRGFGRMVVKAIISYLSKHRLVGLGFCSPENEGFYVKCGFLVNKEIFPRFTFYRDGKKITNSGDGRVIYFDPQQKFINKILAEPDREILLPRPADW